MKKRITITQGKGIHLTFDNGYTISIQFGSGNYCDNKSIAYGEIPDGANTAEVAAWGPGGEWMELGENDKAIGWQSPNDILNTMLKVSKMGAK